MSGLDRVKASRTRFRTCQYRRRPHTRQHASYLVVGPCAVRRCSFARSVPRPLLGRRSDYCSTLGLVGVPDALENR